MKTPLLDELGQAIGQVEYLAENMGATSHIAFMPNRQVLSGELETARFLAVSSTEIDPACFARSTPQTGGFLWDYELPHAVGPGEQREGFYLLARPPEAIKRAVLRATEVVTQSSIDLDALLVETSRRGIPILKSDLLRGEASLVVNLACSWPFGYCRIRSVDQEERFACQYSRTAYSEWSCLWIHTYPL